MSEDVKSKLDDANVAFVIDVGDLLPGDVLLYRPRQNDPLQKRIVAATGGPYTHAAIYLGEKMVAESMVPDGVSINKLDDSLDDSLCIGVLRTQQGFGEDRRKKLRGYVDSVIKQGVPFHRHGLVNFGQKSRAFFDNQLEYIQSNYGHFSTEDQLAAQGYFCSGFVVSCYQAVEIIDNSAQVAYPPEYFSPAHLYQDPAFGWLLGYLVPKGGAVPADDPLLLKLTAWRDINEQPWWASAKC